MIKQHGLRTHHVADGDNRKVEAPGLAGFRISGGRTGRAHAGSNHVRADYKITVRVDRFAGPNHGLPPTSFLGDRMKARNVLVARKCVADQYRVGTVRIELAVSLVSDLERGQLNAGIELQRLVGAEASDKRLMRLVRLARCIGLLTFARQIDIAHIGRALLARYPHRGPDNRGLLSTWQATVNVFFDFNAQPTYQCSHDKATRRTLAGRSAQGDRPHR